MRNLTTTRCGFAQVNAITWLKNGKEGKPTSAGGQIARTKRFQNVVRFVFVHLLIPLLRSVFYVTETEFSGNQVYYYRKPVWKKLRAKAMAGFKTQQYAELSFDDIRTRMQTQNMGCAQLRLLPKKTGVRGISMLSKRVFVQGVDDFSGAAVDAAKEGGSSEGKKKAGTRKRGRLAGGQDDQQKGDGSSSSSDTKKKKSTGGNGGSAGNKLNTMRENSLQEARRKSTNSVLNNSFQVLKFEHTRNPDLFGFGVYGFGEGKFVLRSLVR